MSEYETVMQSITEQGKHARTTTEWMTTVCRILNQELRHYDWVGYYLTDPQEEGQLLLGPYVGEPTEHARISFGQGICGQAAERGATYISADVSQETNYLSCSLKVRSEIVVPILKNGKVIGEIDIDSHTPDAFQEADRRFLEELAGMSAERL